MLEQKLRKVIAMLIMISLIVQMPQTTRAETSNDLGDIVSDVTATLNGELLSDITTPIEITDTTIINLSYKWSVPDSVTVENGDYAEISIPDVFIPIQDVSGVLTDPLDSDVTVGTYTLTQSSKILRLDFNDGLKDRDGKNGTLNFSMKFDVTAFTENVTQTVHFDELATKDFTVSVKPKIVLASMSKTGAEDADLNANSINWTIDVNTSLDHVGNAKITDIIPDGLELVESSVAINKLNVGYTGAKGLGDVVTGFTVNSDTNNLSVDFGAISTAYRISYTTKITDLTKTSFENSATYYNNTTVLKSEKAIVNITRGELLEKTGLQNGNVISWCIDVNKDGSTLTNAILKDTLPNGFSIDSSSVKLYRLSKSGTSWTETDVTSSFLGAVNGTEFNLGNIGKNAYRIKYNTNIVYHTEYQQTEDFTNKAELYDGTTFMDSENCTVTVKRDSVLEKTGVPSISYTKKEITWTVMVNKANHSIGNAVLKDTLCEGLKLVTDSVKIYNKDGIEILPANYAANNITVIAGDTLEVDFGDINTKYKVVYRTTITDYNKESFTNTATLSGSGLGTGPGISYSSTVTPTITDEFSKNQVLNKTLNGITYDGVNYEKKTLSWAIPIKPIKDKITGLTITDTYTNNGMYFLEDSLQIVRGGSETLLKKGIDYTISPKGSGYQYGFIITFNTALQGDYYMIYYKTSFDPNLSDIIPNIYQKYINSAQFVGTGETLDGKKTISNIDVTKTAMYIVNDSAFYTGDKTGTLYKIPERKITWKVHTNYLAQQYTSLTIKDTYGAGQELDVDSIVVKEYSVNANGSVTEKEGNLVLNQDYTITNTPTDKSFSVTFLEGSNKSYVIIYDTLVTGLSKQTYDNKVVVTTNNEPQTYSSTVKDPDYNVFLRKSAANVENSIVYTDDALAWKLTVNKSCSPLSNAVLTDVVSSGLEIDESSLKVYKATSTGENGAEVTSSEYTYAIEALADGTTQLKITFIGNITTQYNIEYSTVVVAETGTISNTANFQADEITTVTVPKVTYTATQTTSGTGTGLYRGSLTITKKDGDTGNLLNAGFQLYYILNGNKKIMGQGTKQTTNGVLVYSNLSYRTYYLEEVTPPLGYETSSEIKTIEISATKRAVACEFLNYQVQATPTVAPTLEPTVVPTLEPTVVPTLEPTVAPTLEPTVVPTLEPTVAPTLEPTVAPTLEPTVAPTLDPITVPTLEPTVTPTVAPTLTPTLVPVSTPMVISTVSPTVLPTITPSVVPPTPLASATPTIAPTKNPMGTVKPSSAIPVKEITSKDMPKKGKIDLPKDSTAVISKTPKHGTVTVDSSGNWKYTPDTSYIGKDNFVVTIKNSDGTESDIYIDIDVDDVPLAGVDDYVLPNEIAKEPVTELPKTGCKNNGIYYLSGIFFTAFGLFYSKRRRANNKL